MATPSYEEIMGQADTPSYDEIVGTPPARRLARSPDLTPEQDVLLSTLPPETPFRTESPVDPSGHNFDGSADWGKVWQAAKEPIPYVGPAISDAVSNIVPRILRYGDVSGIPRIYRSIAGDEAADQIETGIGRGAGNMAAGMASPLGILSAALGGAPKLIQSGATGLFAADMVQNLPDQYRAVQDAQTPQDRAQALTELIGGGAMAIGAGAHALGRPGLVSDADVSARRILRTSPPPSPLLGITLGATPEGPISPPSAVIAAPPGPQEDVATPTVAPGETIGTSNIGAPLEKNVSDMLMLSGGDHEQAAQQAEKYNMPDVAAELRRRAPSLGQGQPPITGEERTPIEGAAAPAILQPATPSYEEITTQGSPAPAPDIGNTIAPPASGELPMGPGKMTVGELPPQNTTGIKRAVVDTERLRRGEAEIPTHKDAANDDEAVRAAEDSSDQDPSAGPALVSRINDGDAKISRQDAAMLLVERQRIINERTQWEQRAGDETADPSEKTLANQRLQQIEEHLTAIDNASRKAGAEWSGIGRMYQRMIQEDFTLDALERKARAAKGESLTPDERETLKQQADAYQKLKVDADALQQKHDAALKQAQDASDLAHAHAQTIKELEAEKAKGTGFTEIVLTQAQRIVDRLRARAEASRIELKNALSQMNAGTDPAAGAKAVIHIANVLAHKVGEFGLDKTKAFAEMVEEYGPKIQPFLEKAWKKVKGLIGDETPDKDVKKAVRNGAGGKGPVDPTARLKADAAAGDELSHKVVYDIWRSHIRAGITDAEAAAKATHETVKQSFPNITEQQVKEIFTEYGKAKFPSKEADLTKLREHRRITQLQLSIERLKAGLDPLKSGLQRDKATQEIRDKQKELNSLLKQKAGPPSPEQLASRNEARITSLKNQIEDLDRQLRTGEAPPESGEPLPDSPEVERLRAERDAMKSKLSEIEGVEPIHPAQKALDTAMVARERAGQTLDDISTGKVDPSKMPREALTQLEEDVRLETDAMKQAAAQMRRDARPKTDEDVRAEAAKIKALDDSIERYRQNTATLARGEQVPEPGKMHGPDSPAVAARREVLESRKSMYETAKKAGIPEPTPAERYNKTRLKQIEGEAKKAQARLDANDYGPRPVKQPKELFAETQEALAKLASMRLEIKKGEAKYREKNRTGSQKFWDGFVGIQRAMKLSSDVLIAKLSLAAIAREALTPMEEGVGSFFSKAFPLLAERAPREGGFSLKAEAIAKAAMFTDGMKDAWQNLKFKESQLSLLNSDKLHPDPKWWDYMGFLHSALKAPVKRAEFARSLAKRTEWAMKEGRDTNDPLVMKELAQEAYIDGERAIFMQDNSIATFFNRGMSMMANSKDYPTAGPGLARLGRFLLPIVKVPTNIVGEVATGNHGLPTGLIRVAHAYAKGVESLPPEQADAIMRQLKKGAIGGALLLTGYLGAKSIGGFYHGPDHRSKDDVQPDQYRVGNVDLPSWFSHSTAAMLLNIGATVARVEKEKSGQEAKGFSGGLLAAGQGLFRKLPFVPALTNIAEAGHDEGGFRKYIQSMLVGSTIPALVQHLAKVEDTPGEYPSNILTPANRRTPKTTQQAFEAAVPILRRNVPFSRGYTPPQPRRLLRTTASDSSGAPAQKRLFRTP